MPLKLGAIDRAARNFVARRKVRKARKVEKNIAKWAPMVGQLADFTTTALVLSKGGREANPIMAPVANSLPLMMAVKVAVGLAQGVLVDALYRSGHKTMARIAGAVGFGTGMGPAVWNAHQLGKMR